MNSMLRYDLQTQRTLIRPRPKALMGLKPTTFMCNDCLFTISPNPKIKLKTLIIIIMFFLKKTQYPVQG